MDSSEYIPGLTWLKMVDDVVLYFKPIGFVLTVSEEVLIYSLGILDTSSRDWWSKLLPNNVLGWA